MSETARGFGIIHEAGKGPAECMCEDCVARRATPPPYDRDAAWARIKARGYISDAGISQDGLYRYWLTRDWSSLAMTGHSYASLAPGVEPMDELRRQVKLPFVMFNPSTADKEEDDATIRKCIGFARRFGYGGIQVVNLYAFRARWPGDMWSAHASGVDVVGPVNDRFIGNMARHSGHLGYRDVVCAWGRLAEKSADRVKEVMRLLDVAGAHPMCLGKTKDGLPRHPLMLSYETKLEPFDGPR